MLLSATVLASIPGAFDQLAQGNIVTRVGVSGEEEAIFLPLAPGLAEGKLCAGKRCVVACSGLPTGMRAKMEADTAPDTRLNKMSCAESKTKKQSLTWHHDSVLGTTGCQAASTLPARKRVRIAHVISREQTVTVPAQFGQNYVWYMNRLLSQHDAFIAWSAARRLREGEDSTLAFFNDEAVFGGKTRPNAVQVWTEEGALIVGGQATQPVDGYLAVMAGTQCCFIEGSEVTAKCGFEFPDSCGAPSGTTHEVVRLEVETLCTAERAGLTGVGLELATRTCASLDSFLSSSTPSPEVEASPEAAPDE